MRFKFDQFVIDGDRRTLMRDDREVHVAPKTFDFLVCLLGRAPNAVSKAELMATLWPDTHVSDATLTGVVADAREAVGDDGRAPKTIRTLHRFGYAFTGGLEREAGADATEPVLAWLITARVSRARGRCRQLRPTTIADRARSLCASAGAAPRRIDGSVIDILDEQFGPPAGDSDRPQSEAIARSRDEIQRRAGR